MWKSSWPRSKWRRPGDLVAIDQHHIQLRQAAGRAGNALEGIHHQHEYAELPLHDLDEARRRHVAELELSGETLARLHRIFEALMAREPQRPAQERRGAADLRRNRAKGRDPSPGAALIGRQALRPDVRLPPGEPALPDEQERIGEIVERRAELLDGDEKLLGAHATLAGSRWPRLSGDP